MNQKPTEILETFYPETPEQWRDWLRENHTREKGIWLLQYNKKSGKPSISWSDAVDEALCYGWIDSLKKKLSEESSIQYFGKRKPKSTWSKINKQKIEKLTSENRMCQAGLDIIIIAKDNGSWEILDSVEELLVPEDLMLELSIRAGAADFFHSLSNSAKKMMLQWLVLAKRPETRQKRIMEIAEAAEKKMKPKQF
ncbi:YdeI/OmpD-associated family protein [Chryseobacterium sp. KACC 21268]|nr:YdeI/OmpD-associated family protein [Chryseobacterium sp. KACC 21268]